MDKIDLTVSHDVLGEYHKLNFDDVREKYRDPGTQYAFDVLDENVTAGYLMKLASFRHLRDLQRQGDADFPYEYSLKEVKNILKFASFAPNVDTGEPSQLMAWQKFILSQLMGWRNNEGGKRYSRAIISVGRGQGKTYILAILMCYTFMMESLGLSNQDYLVSSINYKQTNKLFGYIKSMLKKIITIEPFKSLANEVGLDSRSIQADQIIMRNQNNVIRPISHEAGQYDSFHFTTAIFDEIGEVKSREKVQKIISGQVKVTNRQFIQISTSYPDPTVPFHEDQKMIQQAMEQDYLRDADSYLGLVWAQDSLDEVFDQDSWVKSNPLLDLPSESRVLMQGLKDKRDSDMLSGSIGDFQNKNMNLWLQQSADSYLNLDDVNRAIIPEFNINGRQVYIGFDYSMMSDNTALAFVYPYLDDSGSQKWHIEQHSFIPWNKAGSIEAKEKQDGLAYQELAKQGLCTITSHPEGLINEDQVFEWMMNYVEENNLEVMLFTYDYYGATRFTQRLEINTSWEFLPLKQVTSFVMNPTKFLQTSFVEGSISRLDDKVLEKALLNAVIKEDKVGIQVDKNKATLKIDVVDAIIDALYQGMYHFEEFSEINNPEKAVERMTPEERYQWLFGDSSKSGVMDDELYDWSNDDF
ncbi:terminase large subunit [Weissella viridescens]|uniref:terminase large subunit n=1 Tax=Weissella viridescens TaxID=1629 RepID=UPI003AF27E28